MAFEASLGPGKEKNNIDMQGIKDIRMMEIQIKRHLVSEFHSHNQKLI